MNVGADECPAAQTNECFSAGSVPGPLLFVSALLEGSGGLKQGGYRDAVPLPGQGAG